MSDLPRSRATAVQALIDSWRTPLQRNRALGNSAAYMTQATNEGRRACADELAALLLREGQSENLHESRSPDGDGPLRARNAEHDNAPEDHNGRPVERNIKFPPAFGGRCGQPTPGAGSEPADSRSIALREGPPAPPGHAGPATEPEKPYESHLDALFAAVERHIEEARESGNFNLQGRWMNFRNGIMACLAQLNRDERLAASQAGEAPQEAMPDHCENCRAEMPVTTVHLCHACLPSAPREHAGEALATEPATSWRCFHCDEVFTDALEATQHFGSEEFKTPACRLSSDDVKRLRDLEDENAALRHENDRLDNDARLWHESEADRVRRIGHCQWWQHVDSMEGEKLVLQEALAASQAGTALQQADEWDDVKAAYAEHFPGRPWEAAPREQRVMMLIIRLKELAAHGAVPPE